MSDLARSFQRLALSLVEQIGDPQSVGERRRGMSLYVASAGKGEGKTFVAEALAQHLAALGPHRVLLADANFEAPAIHRRFPPPNGGIGLSDFLAQAPTGGGVHGENARPEAARTELANLHVLTAGTRPVPGLLFQREPVARFLDAATAEFDITVIDSAGLVDSGGNALAYLADRLLLVLDATATRREVAQNALDSLKLDRSRVLGAVLNKKVRYLPRFLYERL